MMASDMERKFYFENRLNILDKKIKENKIRRNFSYGMAGVGAAGILAGVVTLLAQMDTASDKAWGMYFLGACMIGMSSAIMGIEGYANHDLMIKNKKEKELYTEKLNQIKQMLQLKNNIKTK